MQLLYVFCIYWFALAGCPTSACSMLTTALLLLLLYTALFITNSYPFLSCCLSCHNSAG